MLRSACLGHTVILSASSRSRGQLASPSGSANIFAQSWTDRSRTVIARASETRCLSWVNNEKTKSTSSDQVCQRQLPCSESSGTICFSTVSPRTIEYWASSLATCDSKTQEPASEDSLGLDSTQQAKMIQGLRKLVREHVMMRPSAV